MLLLFVDGKCLPSNVLGVTTIVYNVLLLVWKDKARGDVCVLR